MLKCRFISIYIYSVCYLDLLLFQWILTSQEKGEYPICFHSLVSDLYTSLPYCVIIVVLEIQGRKVTSILEFRTRY